jgi:osmotically inducible protein OsmC
MKRSSTAIWNGSGKEGKGHITAQSQVLSKTPYSWKARFEESPGTNPEELLAAAHAGCFTMKLSFLLSDSGHVPDELQTTSTVTLEGGSITESHLEVSARVPGMEASAFNALAEKAKNECPMSKALSIKITMQAQLK